MNLKNYLESIKDKKKENDLLDIYAEEINGNFKYNHYIDSNFIKKYPKILNCELLKYGDYLTNSSDWLTRQQKRIRVYYGQIKFDDYEKAKKES